MLSKDFTDTTVPAKIAQVLSSINFAYRQKQAKNKADIKAFNELRLFEVRNY